ncbi:MAG: class I SAM-dependent methyltransferase [Candidatus Doudnabacteria bacterium]
MADRGWQEYYQTTKNNPTSELLVRAASFVNEKDAALDLGAGALKDSKYLLSIGFNKVVAVDQETIPEELVKPLSKDRFEFVQSSFDKYNFPKDFFDLINAQFSLPFNPPETFHKVMKSIKNSLNTGGIFTGQLFGINDEWKKDEAMTFHTKEQALDYFSDMEILEFTEVDKQGRLSNGQSKHWHFYAVIVRKK